MNTNHGKVSREILNHIYLIGLDRAEKRNAFDSHMIDDLSRALTEYENDATLRCAIIFAHGEHFTAGLDLAELQPKLSSGIFSTDPFIINPWGTSGRKRTKPVIVAVQGYCFTAGIELLLNADIAIAHENAQFTQIEVQRGILPFGGATSRFVKTAGWNKAMRYMLTGDFFDAKNALDMNIISEITKQSPLERAKEIAKTISQAAPLAIQATITSAQEVIELGEDQAFINLNQHLNQLLLSEDIQEGFQAMMQHRTANFSGK